MSDINRIMPGNPIIPPVPQDKAIDERKKKQQDESREQNPDEKDEDSDKDGIDYYA